MCDFVCFYSPPDQALTVVQHCAQTLLDFNGGNSCVQVYVNQHDFFINRVAQVTTEDDATLQVTH
jgi:hypothetical protein